MLPARQLRSELDIYTMPLTLVSEKYGPEGLGERLQHALGKIGLQEDPLIQASLALGLDLHKDDRRTYEPYSNHILRVPLRLIDLGVIDRVALAASLLHDSIEDHAEELARRYANVEILDRDPHTIRRLGHEGLQLFAREYDALELPRIVLDVSNPILLPGEDKNESYVGHVEDLMYEGEEPSPDLKIGDLFDNMDVPGHLENPRKRRALDVKQKAIYPLMRHGLSRPDSLMSDEGRERALRMVDELEDRAKRRMHNLAA